MLFDKSLNFGSQNFFLTNIDTTDGTYDYLIFQNKKGSILIMRSLKDSSESRYYCTSGDYNTVVAAKSSYTYVTPIDLEDPGFSS